MIFGSEEDVVLFFCILIPFLLFTLFFSFLQKQRRKKLWLKKKKVLRAWQKFILRIVTNKRKQPLSMAHDGNLENL